ncbi:hypothetical protein GCM10018966_000630 [Streptomyces yanii]
MFMDESVEAPTDMLPTELYPVRTAAQRPTRAVGATSQDRATPPREHAAYGCLMLMPRIQSPWGSVAVLMRLAPTRLCRAARRGGR